MNPKAIETFSTVGVGVLCIALGIIVLSVFFNLLARMAGSIGEARSQNLTVRGVIKKDTWVAVHMIGGETFERVRLLGFTKESEFSKTNLPPDLYGMVILEDSESKRYLVRSKAIRMILIAPTPPLTT